MSSLIVPSSYNQVQAIERGGDIADITRSVQDGDATVGWRGDTSMDVYREGSLVRVYGFDRTGERYCAATVHMTDSAWRRTLLIKLRDGDWQSTETMVDKVTKANAKRDADHMARLSDQTAEVADKLHFAIHKDNNSKRIF